MGRRPLYFIITTELSWHAVMHLDDPLAIRSMNENTAFQAVRKDPPALKGGGDSDEQKMFFFDPGDITEKGKFGKAFHLTLNYDAFLNKSEEKHIFVRQKQKQNIYH
jgi:hypothetical protein